MSNRDSGSKAASSDLSKLSEREQQLLTLAAAGHLDKQIGQELGISINTLRTYWNRIRHKMGDHSRSALVAAWTAQHRHDKRQAPPLSSVEPWESDDLADSTWEQDLVNGLLMGSNASNKLLGLEAGVWHPLEAYKDLLTPESETAKMAAIEEAASNGSDFFSLEVMRRSNEGFRKAHMFGLVVRNPRGVPMRAVGRSVFLKNSAVIRKLYLGLWSVTFSSSGPVLDFDEEFAEIFGLQQLWDSNPRPGFSKGSKQLHLEEGSLTLIGESLLEKDRVVWETLIKQQQVPFNDSVELQLQLKPSNRIISPVKLHAKKEFVGDVLHVSGGAAAVELVLRPSDHQPS
jgi:DNA-binding CsgD family transcriptional regulator